MAEQRECDIKWLHTDHTWTEGGEVFKCPGIWHARKPKDDPDKDTTGNR